MQGTTYARFAWDPVLLLRGRRALAQARPQTFDRISYTRRRQLSLALRVLGMTGRRARAGPHPVRSPLPRPGRASSHRDSVHPASKPRPTPSQFAICRHVHAVLALRDFGKPLLFDIDRTMDGTPVSLGGRRRSPTRRPGAPPCQNLIPCSGATNKAFQEYQIRGGMQQRPVEPPIASD